jgi:tetrahydromethanopterin S-methyltransferase subunit G
MFRLVLIAVVLFMFSDSLLAIEITKPDFVSGDGKEVMQKAGQTVMDYIAIAFGIMLGVSLSTLAFLAFKGKMDEMWERFQNVIIGVVLFLGAGTAVFSFL